jgi:carbon-monoxide dehydrogenase large subunit
VRLIAPHVGGSFGAKHWAPEDVVAVRVALELDRPVKWVETRPENMIAMPHGRGQVQYLELGLRHDGTIVGLRCRVVGDAGAYGGFGGMLAFGPTRMMSQGVYRIPKIGYDVAVVATNLAPMGAYRGGRPEAATMLERILDMAAAELGMDPVELRRRNFLQPDEFPYSTVTGVTYDVGDYDAALTEALRIAGYDELRAEQAARRERGDTRLLGIGVSAYVEITAGGSSSEYSEVEVHPDGSDREGGHVGARPGPRNRTQLVSASSASRSRTSASCSPTPRWSCGGGTGGSRSLQLGGAGAGRRAVLERARSRRRPARSRARHVLSERHARCRQRTSKSVTWGAPPMPPTTACRSWPSDFQRANGWPVRCARVGRRGRHRDCRRPDPSSRSTTAVDPQPDARRRSGARRAGVGHRPGAVGEMVYDDEGNPSRRRSRLQHLNGRVPAVRVAHTETPSPQPARLEGTGESLPSAAPGGAERGRRRASHLGVRHIDMPLSRSACGAPSWTPAGTCPTRGEPPAAFATLAVRQQSAPSRDQEIDL